MTPSSTIEQVMALAMRRAEAIAPDSRGPEARRVLMYYANPPVASGATHGGQAVTYQAEDLRACLRSQHADPGIWDALPKICVNLVAPIADTLCTLYHDPVQYDWDETTAEGKLAKAMWEKYALQSVHLTAMADVDTKTFLCGLTVPRPVVQERMRDGVKSWRTKYALYTQDQVEYTQEHDDPAEAQQVVFCFSSGQGGASTTERHVWSDDHFVEVTDDNSVKPSTYEGYANPYRVMPFTIFRNSAARGDFFAAPATDLVEAQLALNDLLTAYKDTMIVQGSGTLYVVNGPKGVKLGRRAVIEATVPAGGSSFDAGYVQSGTNFAAWVEAIKLQMTLMLLSRRVPESEVMATQNGESGVSLVALASSLAAWRKRRITIFRPLDQRLVSIALRVRHFHETGQLVNFPEPTATYTELKVPMSQDVRDEIDWLRDNGYISAEQAMLRLNPGMGEEEARKRIADNLKAKRDRIAITLAGRPKFGAPVKDEDNNEGKEGAQ